MGVVCFNDVLAGHGGISFARKPEDMRQQFCRTTLTAMLAICLCAWVTACGKQADSSQTEAQASPEIAELTKQVRRYSLEKRKLPEKMEDLVTAGYIKSVPPAPAGKKYAIDADRALVVLVNQ
jgi:competence protein ComGC